MLLLPSIALAATLTVGPSSTYATPCAAIAAAAEGDTIEVDAAGDYAGDTCAWTTDDLTIRGVAGQPVLDGTGADLAEQKGIFVVHAARARIENLAFVGAAVADQNGAGIRHQGTDLEVVDCLFRDNENGILGSPEVDGTGTLTVIDSEFDHNGHGDGYSHNLYLGHYALVRFEGSYSHRGNIGHLLKSRAARTEIVASRLSDETGGAASYEVDVPNGGDVWIVGSIVEQVGTTQNSAMVEFGAEGPGSNTTHALHVVNSVLVNHHDRGTFLSVADLGGVVEAVNTVFVGPGTLSSLAATTFSATWDDTMGDPGLVDADTLDVHLVDDSPLVDAGVAAEVDLAYVAPTGTDARLVVGAAVDIGAYELGGGAEDTGAEETGAADSGKAAADGGCGCATGQGGVGLGGLAWLWVRRRRA